MKKSVFVIKIISVITVKDTRRHNGNIGVDILILFLIHFLQGLLCVVCLFFPFPKLNCNLDNSNMAQRACP